MYSLRHEKMSFTNGIVRQSFKLLDTLDRMLNRGTLDLRGCRFMRHQAVAA
jgi:hypothetical protein